jgi:hypothetical protein
MSEMSVHGLGDRLTDWHVYVSSWIMSSYRNPVQYLETLIGGKSRVGRYQTKRGQRF